MGLKYLIGLVLLLVLLFVMGFVAGFGLGSMQVEKEVIKVEVIKVVEIPVVEVVERVVEVEKVVERAVYKYPVSAPWERLNNPISFDQALVLLEGMRASHEQWLKWTFESNPGYGLDDIEWYDQLIDFVQRQENNKR